MRQSKLILLVALIVALPAGAAKQKGTTKLKDFQPAGTPNKKEKNQQYDFIFDASGMEYTCRTQKGKLKATDFPVGSDIKYQVDKDKGEVKNMSGKGTKCTIVRVEKVQDTPAASQAASPSPQ
jgi:hypothetical protein